MSNQQEDNPIKGKKQERRNGHAFHPIMSKGGAHEKTEKAKRKAAKHEMNRKVQEWLGIKGGSAKQKGESLKGDSPFCFQLNLNYFLDLVARLLSLTTQILGFKESVYIEPMYIGIEPFIAGAIRVT